MKKKNRVIRFFLWIFLPACIWNTIPGTVNAGEFPVLKGAYLGQEPPGMEPVVFVDGIVSTPAHEYSFTISKDGTEIFFTRKVGELFHIFCFKFHNNKWTLPEIAPFSGKFSDYDQAFSPDGKKLFFVSDRPFTGSNWVGDIWVVERSGSGWSEPERLPDMINTKLNEACPSVTLDGTLYFHGNYSPIDKYDIYRSDFVNG